MVISRMRSRLGLNDDYYGYYPPKRWGKILAYLISLKPLKKLYALIFAAIVLFSHYAPIWFPETTKAVLASVSIYDKIMANNVNQPSHNESLGDSNSK